MKRISIRCIIFMLAASVAALVIQATGFADTEGSGAWITDSADNADASFTMEDGEVTYVEDLAGALYDEAFVNTYSGAEIKLLKDISSESEFIIGSIDTHSCFTLDLNGHTIFCSHVSKGSGKLTIKDSGSGENGTINGKCNFTDLDELTIDGGNFKCPIESDYCGVHLYNCIKATINGGTFEGRYNGMDIDFSNVTINGGTFNATGPIYDGDSVFHGGVIAGLRYNSTMYNSDEVKLRGGTFSGSDYAIQMEDPNPVMTEVRDFLGNSDTDTERYAFYKGDEPIKYGDASLDGKTLEGPITVKLCEHENADYTSENDGVHHTFSCEICGAENVAEECGYGAWEYNGNDMHKASCERCHQEKTEEHNYIIDVTKNNDRQHTFICKGCGHEKSEDHISTAEATCTEKAVCDVCGKEYGDLAGHNPVKTDYKAPTCTEEGNKAYWTCSKCGAIFSDEDGKNIFVGEITIPAAGHTEEAIPAIPATCVKDGSTEGSKCSVCGEIIKAPQTISAPGHNPGTEWQSDADNHWHECTECNEHTDAAAHIKDEGTVVTGAADNDTETIIFKCKVCGYVMDTVSTPEETTAPDETVSPEKTAVPSGFVTPKETASPEKTTVPEEIVTPQETALPEETIAVEETAAPEETASPEETSAAEETDAADETTITIAVTTDSGEHDGNVPTGISVTIIPLALTAALVIAANKFKH